MEQAAKTARDTDTALSCPNDGSPLTHVRAATPQGALIMLDQCGCCGGIWFDRWELFQVDAGRVKELGSVDLDHLRCPVGRPRTDALLCPRCGKPLKAFTDPNLPVSVQMLVCGGCEGIWLNHGEVAGYAGFRQQRQTERSEKLATEYEKMLKPYSRKDYWQTVGELGHQLGGQRDTLTGLPLDGTPAQLARIDESLDIFYTVLGTVVRLLFGWL